MPGIIKRFALIGAALCLAGAATATAADLIFHVETTEWPTPVIRILVSDKADANAGRAGAHTRPIGTCELKFWITADGTIRAAQVTESTGFPELDTACLETLLGHQVPPTRGADGRAVDQWMSLPISWVAMGTLALKPQQTPHRSDAPRAVLASGQTLPIGAADYPAQSLPDREQGICVVHADVSPSMQIVALRITQSSGHATLDQACLGALRGARFVAADADQKSVQSSAEVGIVWLPPPQAKSP